MGAVADAIRELKKKFEPQYPVSLATVISAGTKEGYTRVAITRPDGSQGEQKDVKSDFVVWPGLVVRVSTLRQKFGPDEEAIVGPDTDTYGDSATLPIMSPEHGQTHGYEQGDETSWMHHYQVFPLRVQALSGMTVRIMGNGLYYAGGSYAILRDSLDVDLTPSKPGSGERWVLLTLTAAGSVTLTNGTASGTVQRTSIPAPPEGEYPVGAVRITSATTSISRTNIDDNRHIRPWIADPLPALGTAYQQLQVNAGATALEYFDPSLPSLGTAFQRLRVNTGATALEHFTDQAGFLVILDGGGADLTTGSKGYLTVPFDCKIIGWYCLGDDTDNSIVVDVHLDAGFPAGGALPSTSSIAGTEKPTLSTAASASDLALTTWTTQVLAQGDILEFIIDSVGDTVPERVSITLVAEKR